MNYKDKADNFASVIRKLSKEELRKNNIAQIQKAEEDFDDFKSNLKDGICYLCSKPIATFN